MRPECPRSNGETLRQWLCVGQGCYYLLSGVWPLVSIETFQLVTGPKTDLWLVKTVGILIAVIGASLLGEAPRRRVDFPVSLLAVGSAVGLFLIDVIYSSLHVISSIYLADAAVEALLVLAWAFSAMRKDR